MKKALIDSDICLDVFLQRESFVEYSAKVLSAAESGKFEAFVSGIAFDNIYYVLRKNSNHKRAMDRIKHLRKLVEVGKVSEFTIDKAIDSDWNDFEDSLQNYSAIETDCDILVTRNTTDFKTSELDVFKPAQFLREIGF